MERLPTALVDQLQLKLLRAEEDYGNEIGKAAVPPWLANSVREHVCLVKYLQAMVSCTVTNRSCVFLHTKLVSAHLCGVADRM